MWKLKLAREQTLSYVGKGKGESLLSFSRTPPLPQQEVQGVEKEGLLWGFEMIKDITNIYVAHGNFGDPTWKGLNGPVEL